MDASSSQQPFLRNTVLIVIVILANWQSLILTPVGAQLEGNRSEEQQMKMVNDSSINYLLYHHGDDLLQEVRAIAARHPNIMMVQSWKSEVKGYTSEVVVVTVEPGGKSLPSDKKIRVLLSFGQHGRELITSEVALRLLSILAGEKNALLFKVDAVKEVLRKLIIKVVPMENANGRTKVEAGDYCERKNGRGVDINRNWSIDWGKKEKDFDPTEEFPGNEPFSEPETRIMKELARSFKPHLWINVHSGMEAMFMPYDYKSAMPDATFAEPMKQLLQKLNLLHCNNSCVVGPGGGSVGYLAHGTATDYMYEALKVPLAFTFEIYGDPKASSDDCFRMFNPTSQVLFETTVTNWCAAFFTIFVELEKALKSLPIKSFTWAEDDFTFVSIINKDKVVVSTYPNRERKLFYRNKRLRTLELVDMASSTRRGWFGEDWRTLLEYAFVSSVSLLVLISYVKFRRCPQLLLARHWTIASSSGFSLLRSQREL